MDSPFGQREQSRNIQANRSGHLTAVRRAIVQSAAQLRSYLTETPKLTPTTGWRAGWLRPKGNLTRGELAILLSIAIVPLLIVAVRISALPGVLHPGMSGSLLPTIGHDLNQVLSLKNIPAADRSSILYMLLLPTGAMLIVIARLTFGLHVIGFRAILISVAFQESGIVPSLILIAVVAAIVLGVRPTLVRIKLPYVARVSVIMSIAVLILIIALTAAPWLHSDVLWRVAFFPVIVLGLLAEGIAKTMDRDSVFSGVWRTGMTIVVALVLAGLGQFSVLGEVAMQFPELLLVELVAIFLISEFLDLRICQDWDARLSGMVVPRILTPDTRLRVAVVRNHKMNGVIAHMGPPSKNGYGRRSIRRIVAALEANGHMVKTVEGDTSLLSKLDGFLPEHPPTGEPGGIVLNLSHGIQGEIPSVHVPAMLEMSGVAYTGPTPHGHFIALDKITSGELLQKAGVWTPERRVIENPDEIPNALSYPVIVKPRHALRYKLRIAKDRGQLEEGIRMVSRRDGQQPVVEPYISGREILVALIGNNPPRCLPLIEAGPDREERACPPSLPDDLDRLIRAAAVAAFEACKCRDYALVNIRISRSGKPFVVEVDALGVLESGGAFELAAEAAGYTFDELIDKIIKVTRERYSEGVRVPALAIVPQENGQKHERERGLVAG
ncbi:MAG: hypothetical protein GY725_12525 [bacterium]|nr:hypothetical protein [bacterium]